MPESLKLDATITTTFEKVYDFARMLCKSWSPAFYLSIVRDGKTEFSDKRFDDWLELNKSKINWNILYPYDICNAKIQTGNNKGMRCSKKQKPLIKIIVDDTTGNKEEELVDTGFCGVHKNFKNKWTKSGHTDERLRNSFVYNGEPPTTHKSTRVLNMMNRKIKIPKTFMNEGGPTEEDFIITIEKMAANINKLMDRSILHDNQYKTIRKSVERIISADPKLSLNEENSKGEVLHKAALRYDLYSDGNYIEKESFDELVRNNPMPTFAEVASPEQLNKLKEIKEKKKIKSEEESLKWVESDRIAKEKTEKLRKKLEAYCISTGDTLVGPSFEEVKNSLSKEYISPGHFVLTSKENKEKEITASGVGRDTIKPTNFFERNTANILNKQDYTQRDRQFEMDNMKLWKQGKVFSPFMDPSIDPLQDNVRTIVVKKDENDKEWTWTEYYGKLSMRISAFNRYISALPKHKKDLEYDDQNDRNTKIKLTLIKDMEENLEVVKRKMERVMNSYGCRPKNKVCLLEAMKYIDFASVVMKDNISEYKDLFF